MKNASLIIDGPLHEALRRFKADVFQALAHPTRIAIVEVLRSCEWSAGMLSEKLRIEPANLSQHLSVLRSKQIVVNRKEGNQVYYSLRDPMLVEVLDILRRYFETHLSESLMMLQQMQSEAIPVED